MNEQLISREIFIKIYYTYFIYIYLFIYLIELWMNPRHHPLKSVTPSPIFFLFFLQVDYE